MSIVTRPRAWLLSLFFASCCPATVGQTISTPIVNVQDSASDSAAQPLVLVQGGQTATTLGVEVTASTTTSPQTNPLATLTSIMGNGSGGFGGLSLVQLGNTSTGVSSPPLALCAQQDISGTLTPECWYFQVGRRERQ